MNIPSDLLASEVDLETMKASKTSVATGIELQCVMGDEWPRDRVVRAHQEIADLGIEMILLGADALDAASDLRSQ